MFIVALVVVVTIIAESINSPPLKITRLRAPVSGFSTVAGFIGNRDGVPGQAGEGCTEVFAVAAPNGGLAGARLRCHSIQGLWFIAGRNY